MATPIPSADCPLCPRLVDYRLECREKFPDWHNAPVPSFSDSIEKVQLLIVGLAPGLRGANRTGRPFTGDWAGDLLYAMLLKHGLAKGEYKSEPDDGVKLIATRITNAVRCVPPQNKPVGAECAACRPFLVEEITALPNLKVIMCLGRISHDNTLRALGIKLKDAPFSHGGVNKIEGPNGALTLIDSYHCSRYNTNTGRLTEEMFSDVFVGIRNIMKS